jgi:hypothetical protein
LCRYPWQSRGLCVVSSFSFVQLSTPLARILPIALIVLLEIPIRGMNRWVP